MKTIRFFVPGQPKPQGRPRAFSRGKFTKVYSPQTEWRCTVLKYACEQLEESGKLEGALQIHIDYQFNRPKSHYGTGKNANKLKESAPEYHTKKPDLDNLNKAILDALGDSGLIGNDSQVCSLSSNKVFGFLQGAEITITEVI